MTFQESIKKDIIQAILDKKNSKELYNFPLTKNRLIKIVIKIQTDKVLSESDFITLKLNNII